jgi:hypothetical protein
MKNFSIEFGHFYADTKPHKKHNKILKEIISNIDNYEINIFIDNYNVDKNNQIFHSIEDIKNFYLIEGIIVNNIHFENDMSKNAKIILENLGRFNNKKDKIYYKDILLYDFKKNKYSCSLLSSVYYLIRLGIIEDINYKKSKQIINILDEKYKNVEEKTLLICQNFVDLKRIKNIYV